MRSPALALFGIVFGVALHSASDAQELPICTVDATLEFPSAKRGPEFSMVICPRAETCPIRFGEMDFSLIILRNIAEVSIESREQGLSFFNESLATPVQIDRGVQLLPLFDAKMRSYPSSIGVLSISISCGVRRVGLTGETV